MGEKGSRIGSQSITERRASGHRNSKDLLVQYQRWLCEQSTSFAVRGISKKNATPQTAVLSSVSSFVAALPEEVGFNTL